jgi:uncharacterized protein
MFRKRTSRPTRVFFATDIHGSDRCFRKFLAASEHYAADILILGGDIVGKGLVLVEAAGDMATVELGGEVMSVSRDRVEELRSGLNRRGLYSVTVPRERADDLRADKGFIARAFRTAMETQVEGWCELARGRLPARVRCIITPGNDDPLFVDDILAGATRVECPERELCDLGPVVLASLGDVTPTPWDTEREYSEEALRERIDSLVAGAPADRPVMWNFHCPPFGTGLDLAPELDSTLRPVVRGGQVSMVPVGSKAVRAAVEEYQPVVALHGHIHEARGVQRVKESLCVNPGSDYGADVLRGALIDLGPDGRCVDFLLTAG